VLRDQPGPVVGPRELTLRRTVMHTLGIRGRSAAIRARPVHEDPQDEFSRGKT